jgi:hypothetical protein
MVLYRVYVEQLSVDFGFKVVPPDLRLKHDLNLISTHNFKKKKPFFFFFLYRTMSANVPISESNITAPTPQNTPLTHAPISAGLSRPTVPDISEDNEGEEETTTGGAAAMQTAMLGMVQGKLAGLVGKSSGYIESLPVEVKKSVEALKGVQVKQNELQNRYKRECLELEKKVLFLIHFFFFWFF